MTPLLFNELQEAIFEKRPILKKIFAESDGKSLAEYAASYREHFSQVSALRKSELIRAVQAQASLLLGEEVGASVAAQLLKFYYVSTTDHHGPLTHPFFVHANLLAATSQLEKKEDKHNNLIVLACSNVSLNNSSFPRSLLFHIKGKSDPERLHFFPAKDRLMPVFRHRPFDQKDLARMENEVNRLVNTRILSLDIAAKLKSLLKDVYAAPDVLLARSYSDQITKTNFDLWQRFFTESSVTLPNLIYLNLEEIVVSLLLEHHMDTPTTIHRFMFSEELRAEISRRFDGIPGTFSHKEHKGTFLFWYFPANGKTRIPLWLEDGYLVSEDRTQRILLDPKEIKAFLERQELIPSIMLCLVTLSSYYGLKCLGGFSQTTYLTMIDQAYESLFPEEASVATPTQSLCGDFSIGFLKNGEKLDAATGLDFILYGSKDSWDKFKNTANKMSVPEGLSTMLPEMYHILYGATERQASLATLTSSHIWDHLDLSGKVDPCLDVQIS